MSDPLAWFEDEMAVAATEAVVRTWRARERMQSADADLALLQRPTWGGVVDEWHDAAAEVADSTETLAAYEAFWQ